MIFPSILDSVSSKGYEQSVCISIVLIQVLPLNLRGTDFSLLSRYIPAYSHKMNAQCTYIPTYLPLKTFALTSTISLIHLFLSPDVT